MIVVVSEGINPRLSHWVKIRAVIIRPFEYSNNFEFEEFLRIFEHLNIRVPRLLEYSLQP